MIGVNPLVIVRIHRLKDLTVEVRAGRAVRKYRIVRSDGPSDLVFQSVGNGKPMRDGNILRRFIKPAARSLGLGWVNWCLAGADGKDAQGQMRHAQASTTLNIYQHSCRKVNGK
jgi:integrase